MKGKNGITRHDSFELFLWKVILWQTFSMDISYLQTITLKVSRLILSYQIKVLQVMKAVGHSKPKTLETTNEAFEKKNNDSPRL